MTDEDEPNPFYESFVTIDPKPELAEALSLPVRRWYCALQTIQGEEWTAITFDAEAAESLFYACEDGVQPPEEFAAWVAEQFEFRPGWPLHWFHAD